MVSYTKLIAHSSSAAVRFSKEAVGVKLTWSAGKCTLVTAQETGEGLKMVRAVKRSVNLCCDTVRLTLQLFRFAKKGEYRLFSLYKILKRLVKSLQIQDTLSLQTRPWTFIFMAIIYTVNISLRPTVIYLFIYFIFFFQFLRLSSRFLAVFAANGLPHWDPSWYMSIDNTIENCFFQISSYVTKGSLRSKRFRAVSEQRTTE